MKVLLDWPWLTYEWVVPVPLSSPRNWPGSMPFTCSLSPPWPLMLPGCEIPFWKAFDKPNIFLIPLLQVMMVGTPMVGGCKGGKCFHKLGNFYPHTANLNQIVRNHIFYFLSEALIRVPLVI